MAAPGFWLRLSRGRRMLVLAVVFLLVVLAIFKLALAPQSEEERVKAGVLEAIQAAENESVPDLADAISKNYRGYYGTDFDDLMARAERDFKHISNLSISPKKWNIRIDGNMAVVNLEFTFHLIYDKVATYSNVPINRLPGTPRGENDKARLVLVRDSDNAPWKILEMEVQIPEH